MGRGEFSGLPPVQLLPASAMPGAAGAYAISTGTLALNQQWLATASREQALAALTEELGHHLDGLLNRRESPGDQGELFALLLHSNGPSQPQPRQAALADNDQDRLWWAGRPLLVEQAAIVSGTPIPAASPGRSRQGVIHASASVAQRSDGFVVSRAGWQSWRQQQRREFRSAQQPFAGGGPRSSVQG